MFVMHKDDGPYFYNISDGMFRSPRSIISYLDKKVLVADGDSIKIIDSTIYPPTEDSVYPEIIGLPGMRDAFGLTIVTSNPDILFGFAFNHLC